MYLCVCVWVDVLFFRFLFRCRNRFIHWLLLLLLRLAIIIIILITFSRCFVSFKSALRIFGRLFSFTFNSLGVSNFALSIFGFVYIFFDIFFLYCSACSLDVTLFYLTSHYFVYGSITLNPKMKLIGRRVYVVVYNFALVFFSLSLFRSLSFFLLLLLAW